MAGVPSGVGEYDKWINESARWDAWQRQLQQEARFEEMENTNKVDEGKRDDGRSNHGKEDRST